MLSNKAGFVNFKNVTTENQPFPNGLAGCNQFRIPGIIRLKDGRLFAAVDARWDCAKNDFGGIDTMYSVSDDEGKTWHPSFAAYFPDSNGTPKNAEDTTTCIDSCCVQDCNGRVHIIVNMNPTGITTGLKWPGKGNGFIETDGGKYLALTDDYLMTDVRPEDIPENKLFYINNERKIISAVNGKTEYTVDGYFNIYKNGEPVYQKQIDSGDEVQQNVFYRNSCFHVYNTVYHLHLYTDDCEKWNAEIISDQIKKENETGLISSPGNGTLTSDGIIAMPFYDTETFEDAASLIIYSEDDGYTWKRTPELPADGDIKISTEGKIVELKKGLWRLFFRNQIKKICYADYDFCNGKWLKPVILPVTAHTDCNYSAIMNNGKIYVSAPAGRGADAMGRVNGKLYVFDIDSEFNMTLTEEKPVEENAFSYSCITALLDGRLCVLFDTCDEGIVKFRKI